MKQTVRGSTSLSSGSATITQGLCAVWTFVCAVHNLLSATLSISYVSITHSRLLVYLFPTFLLLLETSTTMLILRAFLFSALLALGDDCWQVAASPVRNRQVLAVEGMSDTWLATPISIVCAPAQTSSQTPFREIHSIGLNIWSCWYSLVFSRKLSRHVCRA